jgi:hypothetical protein
MMDCFTIRAAFLRPSEKAWIASRLTRPGSDFQKALESGEPQGWISIALDKGVIIGWARTERWEDFDTLEAFVDPALRSIALDKGVIIGWARTERWEDFDTLEAFVDPALRGRGVATWCAMGLVASGVFTTSKDRYVAVFRRPMIKMAIKVGMKPVICDRLENGLWTRCH